MRYHQACRLFKNKHWETLWQSNIPDLNALKERCQYTFVAIDFEGRITKDEPIGITEIGLAVLTPSAATSTISPDDLRYQGQAPEIFFKQNAIESYSIQIKGRERKKKYRDRYRFGPVQEIEAEQAEDTLVSLLQSIRHRSKNPLVLVGFDLVFEFKTIASHLSQITQYFTSWIDLQEIMTEISNTKSPGMKASLLTFGFFSKDLTTRGKWDHSAGNDAVHELAILVNLLNLSKGNTIHIQPIKQLKDENTLRRIWSRSQPGPRELYPFTAMILLEGKRLKSFVPHLPHLLGMFSSYRPSAVGMARNGNCGWICLSTAEDLNRFINDLHGHEFKGETWIAVTDYDPQISHPTPEQLREARRAKQEAQREQKQQERRAKREVESDYLVNIR
ncbi:uncharacterized protein GGS22DRAFT_194397 [Annulohypoxylon maeteangense]|uniref:uncharacterized protein n=1 Tax=Annulohypoxylon maeteangense TaxID=1927788 RepID=UPI0020086E11|nr:uncharacterized protein GGS22DRAFT_194397 [Annulohypoxylon maeteangense]KAI0890254.1 hypothetical protein GGS22DRAFT_194397 [Annulohypoxylon maeteangense]